MKKLIRDKIPDIMKSKWLNCNFHVWTELEYHIELLKKLVEEAIEVKESNTKDELIIELADINEVINSICVNNWIMKEEIEIIRLKKLKEKWWFDKKYIYKF